MGFAGILLVLVGAGLGFAIAWLLVRPDAAVLNARLTSLQQELTKMRNEAAKLTDVNNHLTQAKVKLETAAEHERKASDEKLALLTQMTEELRDSFQALSSEALKSNNQAFLHLAQSTLEKFQSEAKGDLELRQQAVNDEKGDQIHGSGSVEEGSIVLMRQVQPFSDRGLSEHAAERSRASGETHHRSHGRAWEAVGADRI